MPNNGVPPAGAANKVPETRDTRRSIMAKLGLAAGGAGLAALGMPDQSAAARLNGSYDMYPPAGSPALHLFPSGAVSPSVSAGGAFSLDNSASTGAGAVLYSGRGADALGRLLVVNQANPANPQHAVRIKNIGTAHTLSILHDPAGGAGDPTALAVDVVSTNPLDTTLGVRGREEGRGTVKISHEKPANPDSDAAALSIAIEGAGTACQGIFIGNQKGDVTTGNLLNIRNGGVGTERLVLTADGQVELAVEGPGGGFLIGADANLYRAAPEVLATDGTLQAPTVQVKGSITLDQLAANPPPPPAPGARVYQKDNKLVIQWSDGASTLYTTIQLDSPGPYPAQPAVTTDTTEP
jgi:hypothetical protein